MTESNNLGTKTTQLQMLNKRLEYSQKYQKAIFDGQPNLIVTNCNGQGLCDGNKAFLTFVGFPDVPSFLAEHDSICDYFIDREGYLSSIVQGKSWLEYVKDNPEYSHYALIEKENKEHVFTILCSKLTKKSSISTYTRAFQAL